VADDLNPSGVPSRPTDAPTPQPSVPVPPPSAPMPAAFGQGPRPSGPMPAAGAPQARPGAVPPTAPAGAPSPTAGAPAGTGVGQAQSSDAAVVPAEIKMPKSSRWRVIAGGALTVVVLALVIFGLSALSAPKRQQPQPIQLTKAQQSEQAYQAAEAALASDETTKAVILLQRAVALDPANTLAQTRLETLLKSSTKKPTSTGSNTASTTPGGSSTTTPTTPIDFAQAVSDLNSLLPTKATGYVVGTASAMGADATVSGDSEGASAVRYAEWTVHDRKTPSAATQFVTGVSRSLYTKDSADVTVAGTAAYFGTDGVRLANVSFARGRYAFELTLVAENGSPGSLQQQAIKAAEAFPTTR
jgi:hypothetical protein